MKSVREVLVAARALIDTPEKWTKGSFARDSRGAVVGHLEDGAVCWCSMGAISRAARVVSPFDGLGGIDGDAVYQAAMRVFNSQLAEMAIIFNDRQTTTHADVMALFDRAIAACQEVES